MLSSSVVCRWSPVRTAVRTLRTQNDRSKSASRKPASYPPSTAALHPQGLPSHDALLAMDAAARTALLRNTSEKLFQHTLNPPQHQLQLRKIPSSLPSGYAAAGMHQPRRQLAKKEFAETLDKSRTLVWYNVESSSAATWEELRLKLSAKGIFLKLFPNGPVIAHLGETRYASAVPLIMGPIITISSPSEPLSSIVKILRPYSDRVTLLGAITDRALLSAAMVKKYIELPDISQLHSEMVGLLSGPAAQLSSILSSNPQALASTLAQLEKQKSEM